MVLLGAKGARQYLDSPTSPITFLYVVFYDVFTHGETLFYILYVVASALGFIGFPFFYCYHLLYLVVSSDTLQNVVRAVTQPIQALSLTFLLTFIIIYVFTMLYFFYQPERFWNTDAGQNECDTLGRCYIVFVRNGLLAGGGIGDYVAGELGHAPNLNDTGELFLGTVFDLLFFIIVLILLLNIVFGIIIGKLHDFVTRCLLLSCAIALFIFNPHLTTNRHIRISS
jgi:inositol 1,4,5-triphosphate receptor type 3